MSNIVVEYRPTPNPNAGKFTLNRPAVEGNASRTYSSAAQAAADPVAAALFELDGVMGVFMVADFVTVTKAADADWSTLAPSVIETIEKTIE